MAQIRTLFQTGQVLATPGALCALGEAHVGAALLLARHQFGDWGEVGAADWELNNRALREGTQLLSAYTLPTGVRLWVITEGDRRLTTLLLPSEY